MNAKTLGSESQSPELRFPETRVGGSIGLDLSSRMEMGIDRTIGLVDSLQAMPNCSSPTAPTLSIVIPVYNEIRTIVQVIESLQQIDINKEIIVVDDGSTDGTREVLIEAQKRYQSLIVHLQPSNQGKGAALSTGFARCRGEIVIVQDADFEYSPQDIPAVIEPIRLGLFEAVYGSRYLNNDLHIDRSWIHRAGNAMLTCLSNLFTGQKLTDMETAYKAFRRELIQSIDIEQKRFGFEPEVTAKLSARRVTVGEVPIRYAPRSKQEGKKIGWKDLVSTLYCILRYRSKRPESTGS